MGLEERLTEMVENSRLDYADIQEAKIQRNIVVSTNTIENSNYDPLKTYMGLAEGMAIGLLTSIIVEMNSLPMTAAVVFGGYAGTRIAINNQFKRTTEEYMKFVKFIEDKSKKVHFVAT